MKKISFLVKEGYSFQVDSLMNHLKRHYGYDAIPFEVRDLNSEILIPKDQSDSDMVVTIHSIGEGLPALFTQLRNSGTPTLTIQDGIIEHSHCWVRKKSLQRYRPVLTDMIAVLGNFSKDILIAWGASPDSIIATGIPRLDYLSGIQKPSESGPVLLTCANTPFHDEGTKQSFKRIFLAAISELNAQQIQFTLRVPKKALRLLDYDSPPAEFSDASNKATLARDLGRCNSVITTMSTVAIEAMACDRPTCIINPDNLTQYFNTPWTITHIDEIPTIITELQKPRPEKMRFQEVILQYHFNKDFDATKKVCSLIHDMIKNNL